MLVAETRNRRRNDESEPGGQEPKQDAAPIYVQRLTGPELASVVAATWNEYFARPAPSLAERVPASWRDYYVRPRETVVELDERRHIIVLTRIEASLAARATALPIEPQNAISNADGA